AGVLWAVGTTYTTEAVIEVFPRYVGILGEDSELEIKGGYLNFVENQALTLRSYEIAREALQKLREASARPEGIEADEASAARLADALEVRHVRNTYRIVVSLSSKEPQGIAEVVNAVVQAYLHRVNKQEKFIAEEERVRTLQTQQGILREALSGLLARKAQIAQSLGVVRFDQDRFENPYDRSIVGTKTALGMARRRRIEAEAALAAFAGRDRDKVRMKMRTGLQDLIDQDPGHREIRRLTNAVLIQRKAEIAGLPPDSSRRRAAEQEISEIESHAKEEERRLTQRYVRKIEDDVILEWDAIQTSFLKARENEDLLQQEYDAQKEENLRFAALYEQAVSLRSEIDRTREQLGAIQNRLDTFAFEKDAPGIARVSSPARAPALPEMTKLVKILILFVAAALLLSVAGPTAVDYFDPRVLTPLDAMHALRFPPLGWVLERRDRATEAFAADQLRRLALLLNRQRTLEGHRRFVLTSPKAGGGTSELALELAQTLSGIGVRTVAVEVNAFRPDPRYAPEDPGRPGLSAVLAGKARAEETIVPGDGRLPDRIPLCETSPDRHISRAEKIPAALDSLQYRYDLFLLDAPPMLLSADAEILSGVVGVTLLVVEAESITFGEVKRAAGTLKKNTGSVLGVIVNRVRVHLQGGYFSELLKEYESGRKLPRSGLLYRLFWGRRP
ncbi:MAG: hypothetical protein V1918_00255, partial [Planctomycetota bacterium]